MLGAVSSHGVSVYRGLLICGWASNMAIRCCRTRSALMPAPRRPAATWKGKEVRFGITTSVLTAVTTSNGATGSYNSMHDSYTPIGAWFRDQHAAGRNDLLAPGDRNLQHHYGRASRVISCRADDRTHPCLLGKKIRAARKQDDHAVHSGGNRYRSCYSPRWRS